MDLVETSIDTEIENYISSGDTLPIPKGKKSPLVTLQTFVNGKQ